MELLRELMSFQSCEDMQKTPMIMDKSGKFTFGTWVILAAIWKLGGPNSEAIHLLWSAEQAQVRTGRGASVEIWILLYFIDAFKGNVLQ